MTSSATAPINARAVVEGNPSLGKSLLTGTSLLAVAMTVERGLGFIANVLAARIGGSVVFGGYALALTTANNVASYAGSGIGATASRFSGQFPNGTRGYADLLRSLALVTAVSVLLAVAVLWGGARFVATHLLGNARLTPLLQVAAFSAGALILLECFRGLLIGQRQFKGLLVLSSLAGGGFVLALPWAARLGPQAMIVTQAAVAVGAVAVVILLARQLRITPKPYSDVSGDTVRVFTVWSFGMVQLASIVGLNAAGWWVASLVTRADTSLAQMGLYSVASQLRNLVAMAPGLVSQSSYALFTKEGGNSYGGAGRVMALCTVTASSIALLLAGVAIAVLPWGLRAVYGSVFANAELPASLAISTGLIHMAAAPAASRLTIVSLRATGIINGIWTVAVIALSTRFVPGGGATEAAAVMLAGQLMSAILVLIALRREDELPAGMLLLSIPSWSAGLVFAAIACIRYWHPAAALSLSFLLALSTAVFLSALLMVSRSTGWVANPLALMSRFARFAR